MCIERILAVADLLQALPSIVEASVGHPFATLAQRTRECHIVGVCPLAFFINCHHFEYRLEIRGVLHRYITIGKKMCHIYFPMKTDEASRRSDLSATRSYSLLVAPRSGVLLPSSLFSVPSLPLGRDGLLPSSPQRLPSEKSNPEEPPLPFAPT